MSYTSNYSIHVFIYVLLHVQCMYADQEVNYKWYIIVCTYKITAVTMYDPIIMCTYYQMPWLLFISSPEFVQHLLIPVAQSIQKWSIDTAELGDLGPFANVEECYILFAKYLSCTCHRERAVRHVHMLMCFSNSRCGVATIQEQRLLNFIQHFRRCGEYSRAASDRANTV